MNSWSSFLQTVFRFVKSLFGNVTKEMHRNTAVLTAGAVLIAVVPFTAVDFQGGGRNAMVAFAETQTAANEAENELETEEESVLPETEEAEAKEEQQPLQNKQAEQEQNAAAEPDTETTEKAEKETEAVTETASIETTSEETAAEKNASEEEKVKTEEAAGEIKAEEAKPEKEHEKPEEKEVFSGYSESDYNVLLRIVQAEAGNCDLKGRILVANVILNRVEDDEFPDTITDVVYERHQFSPVQDGSIKRCRVTDQTREAVDRALAGEDYSEGALYFMNRKTAAKKNVRWFDNHLDYLFKHGSHEFFR